MAVATSTVPTTLEEALNVIAAHENTIVALQARLNGRNRVTAVPNDAIVKVSCRIRSCSNKGEMPKSEAFGWGCPEHAAP
jgi:hypothetical protein